MFINKNYRKYCAIAACLVPVLIAGTASATTNTPHELKITGEVIGNPCEVTLPAAVSYGNFNNAQIGRDTTQPPSNMQPIEIYFRKCTEKQKATISFVGTAGAYNQHVFANTATDNPATNAAIGFWGYDQEGNWDYIDANTGETISFDASGSGTDGTRRIMLVTGVVRDDPGMVSPGNVSADVSVKINYL
ncbi:fimbrial protein [Lelliottia sp.]|uniref:fimbrial protein n=1 Tax=Lelliottia sp. TaxID=1898429 RepID=UPI00388FD527